MGSRWEQPPCVDVTCREWFREESPVPSEWLGGDGVVPMSESLAFDSQQSSAAGMGAPGFPAPGLGRGTPSTLCPGFQFSQWASGVWQGGTGRGVSCRDLGFSCLSGTSPVVTLQVPHPGPTSQSLANRDIWSFDGGGCFLLGRLCTELCSLDHREGVPAWGSAHLKGGAGRGSEVSLRWAGKFEPPLAGEGE